MQVFQSSLPTTGQGVLRHREDTRMFGTETEHTLLNPVDTLVLLKLLACRLINFLTIVYL